MKTFVALFALFAVALAAAPVRLVVTDKPIVQKQAAVPVLRNPTVAVVPRAVTVGSSGSNVLVLKQTLHNYDGHSGYQYSYELSDGSARDENGQVETRGAEGSVFRVTGSFRFVAPDGQTYTVTYTADENGFHPQGAHLPVDPSVH